MMLFDLIIVIPRDEMLKGIMLALRMHHQVITQAKNSINPVSEFVAFGHYFPKEWS